MIDHMDQNLFPQSNGASQQFPDPTPRPSGPQSNTTSGVLGRIEQLLMRLLARPAIPTAGKEMLAAYLPWLVLMVGLVMLPIIITGILNSGLLATFTSIGTLVTNPAYWTGLVLFTVQFVLVVVAIIRLMARRLAGWKFVFVASLIGLATAVANAFAGFINPFVTTPLLLILSVAALYLLVLLRSYFPE